MEIIKNLSIIAAVAQNRVIGKGNKLPWQLSADLRYFAQITNRHTVIVGRNTHESILARIGSPLKNRKTIVLSRDPHYQSTGCTVVFSLAEAIHLTRRRSKVFVIGGRQVYAEALPVAFHLYITQVLASPPGDIFFPSYNKKDWQLTSAHQFPADSNNQYPFRFEIYQRKEQK